MIDVDTRKLLDCAHVDTIAGVCQYEGCQNELCSDCTATCDKCRIVLCPMHQAQPDGHARVYCPDHVTQYAVKQLLRALTNR